MDRSHMPNRAAADVLADESAIVWIPGFEPGKHRYVREAIHSHASRRRGPLRWSGRVVGWTELAPDAERTDLGFFRRVFWLAEHDPYEAGGGAPCEAVDPMTVVPGRPGRLTEMAWGKPFKKDAEEQGARR